MKRVRAGVIALAVVATLPLGAQQPAPASAPATSEPETLVLPTAQTIDFETDEVTWMSVDVSPDGRTIVFDLLGDLYTLPIDGGAATRIVGGMSFESQPTWSPDGASIAFLSDRTGVENLWIANADGSNPRAVSRDRRTDDRPQILVSPAWTPDGQYLVVSKSRPPDPRRSRHQTPPDRHRRRRPTGWARPCHLTAGSSTTRNGRAASATTPVFRCGKSIATTATPATCRK